MRTARLVLEVDTEPGWRGGENQFLLLVRGLSEAPGVRFTPLAVCRPGSPLLPRIAALGLPFATVPIGPGRLPLAAARLRHLVKERGPVLVHAHSSRSHTLALLATAGLGVPLVVSRRVDFPSGEGLLGRFKYGRAARFVAVSNKAKDVLAAGGVPAERIAVVLDGIDFARFASPSRERFRQEFSLDERAVAVGMTAHLADHKDHATLLRAWALVEREEPGLRLFLVGQGELEGELKLLARSLGLRGAVFTGWREDVPDVLAGLDVYVHSSHLEGLGSAIMDAMYCRLPVVACRSGGIPELIRDGEDGLLVPKRDPEALAAAILRASRDADLRRRLGEAARRTAEARFGAAAMVAGTVEAYRRVLQDAGAGPDA